MGVRYVRLMHYHGEMWQGCRMWMWMWISGWIKVFGVADDATQCVVGEVGEVGIQVKLVI